MKTLLGSIAFIIGLFAIHAIPGFLVAITPEWLSTGTVVFLFAILPVTLFIILAVVVGKAIKEGNI